MLCFALMIKPLIYYNSNHIYITQPSEQAQLSARPSIYHPYNYAFTKRVTVINNKDVLLAVSLCFRHGHRLTLAVYVVVLENIVAGDFTELNTYTVYIID